MNARVNAWLSESAEGREARLKRMSERQAVESTVEREARLQRMSECLALESAKEGEDRLQQRRDRLNVEPHTRERPSKEKNT